MQKTRKLIFFIPIVLLLSTGPLISQELCDNEQQGVSGSCSMRSQNEAGKNVAHYEFSRATLSVMKIMAEESNSSIANEIDVILNHMARFNLDAVGIFYEPQKIDSFYQLTDCHFYLRPRRGTLEKEAQVYRFGSSNCYSEGTALIFLFGKAIDQIRESVAGTGVAFNYLIASNPNYDRAFNSNPKPISELLSIINYHNIGKEEMELVSSVLNIDIVEITAPTVLYVVQKGDSMYGISKMTTGKGNNWQDIWALNPQIKKPSSLKAGDEILLPPMVSGWEKPMQGITDKEIAETYFGDQVYHSWVASYRNSYNALTGTYGDIEVPVIEATQKLTPYQVFVPILRTKE